ncbi:hypothetical protein ILUMI_20768 [Ignelater luminosus]|uniref:G domain-containing protein n=1 Tax=Ignelater luminosus TaxID=2038154 RepID=A0A8K0CJ38_IGNLU|nr:hypothetical protein ILUMI_20768 [Ignelater luminosus]
MTSDTEDNALLKQQIIQCLQAQEESITAFKELIKSKDVTIFLGNTRNGKSTLVNYLLDNKLIAWEERRKIFKIRMDDDNCEGPEIGQGSLSCTTIPGVYAMPGNAENVIVDCPGFEDNRGVVQDIMNALCISQIKTARTVKFVLVFDINDITNDNIGNFICTLQQTQNLVRNFDELKNSFCVIFMKDFRDYSQDDIVELFMNKVLNVEELDMDKTLVRNFVQNKKLIGIFRMPEQAGEVSSDVDVNVKGAIKECHQVDVDKCEILFALSDKAQEVLLEIYPEYTDTCFFEEKIIKMVEPFADYFDIDKYVYASYDEELKETKDKLEIISTNLIEHGKKQRTHLLEIQASLDELLECRTCDEFETNFKFITMLDWSKLLEERFKDMIMMNYENSLLRLHEEVDCLVKKIDAEMKERLKYKIKFGFAGSASAVGFASSAVAGTIRMLSSTAGSAGGACTAAEVATGGAATIGVCVVGAAVGGAGIGIATVLYKEHYGKRKDARRAQNRQL